MGLGGIVAVSIGIIVSSLFADLVGGGLLAITAFLFIWFVYEYGFKFALEQFLGMFIRPIDENNFTVYISPETIHELKSLDLKKELEDLYKDVKGKLKWDLVEHKFEFDGFAIVAHFGELMALSRFHKGWVALGGILRRTKVADVEATEVWRDVIMYEPELSRMDRLRVVLHMKAPPEKFGYEYIPYLFVSGSDVQAKAVRSNLIGLNAEFKDANSFEKAIALVRKEAVHVWSTNYREKTQVLETHIEDLRDVLAGKDRNDLTDKTPELGGDEGGISVDWKKWAKRFAYLVILGASIYALYWFATVYLGITLPPAAAGNSTSTTTSSTTSSLRIIHTVTKTMTANSTGGAGT